MLVGYQANFVVANNLKMLSQNETGSYVGDLLYLFFFFFSCISAVNLLYLDFPCSALADDLGVDKIS